VYDQRDKSRREAAGRNGTKENSSESTNYSTVRIVWARETDDRCNTGQYCTTLPTRSNSSLFSGDAEKRPGI